MRESWKILLKRQKGGEDFIALWVCIESAHNPAAAAGSLVQIQPPQPNFFRRACPLCAKFNAAQSSASRIQRSSVVERSAVNRLVVGSNPTAGANF